MHKFWNNGFNDMTDFTHFNSNWFFLYGIFRVLITIVLIVVVIIFVVKMLNKDKPGHNRAIDILKQRYASGELSEQEYKDRLKVLND